MRSSSSVLAATAFSIASANAALYNKVINTKFGSVVGYPAFNSTPANYTGSQWKDIAVFKGIPFAASTGGNNRWRAPQPAEPWNTTLYASDFGDVCPSATTNSNYTFSEDCLNLNIWTPANSSSDKLPVMMWSYPAESTARDDLFNGGGMAAKGIVFVNYNYRTGSGNWGMLDQFAALTWIRENIQNFGGDPEHITVMGQSAGSADTYHILNSPLTKGDIVGAIIESGVRDAHDPLCGSLAENYSPLSASISQGVAYLASLNVSTIAQARKLPYTDLETSFMGSQWSWSATLDHYAMPATYLNTLLNGSANQVPVLTGNTKDESGATCGLNITLATYLFDLNSTYNGTWIHKFREAYPANDSVTASGAYNSQFTDRSKAGTYLWSQLLKNGSSKPVYNYFWNHAPPGQTQGAYHESEINYMLNNLYDTDFPWEAKDYVIAGTMNGYWANFIKNGDPNGEGLVEWPATTGQQEAMVQVVGDSFQQEPVVNKEKLQLFKQWFAGWKAY